MFIWIFKTDYVNVAVRLAAGYIRLWARVFMLGLRLLRNFVDFIYRFCLLYRYWDKLVPVWFLKNQVKRLHYKNVLVVG